MLAAGPVAADRAQVLGTTERMIRRILLVCGCGRSSTTTTTSSADGILLLAETVLVVVEVLLLQGGRDLLVERGTARTHRTAAVISRGEGAADAAVQQRNVRLQVGLHVRRRERAHVSYEGGIET